jgi:S1-C subfamily serine protease
VWILLLTCSSLVGDLPISRDQERAFLASTVRIIDHSTMKGGVGTGAIIGSDDKGFFVLTAFHVIDPGEAIDVQWFDEQRRPTTCGNVKILGSAPEADLGLLFVRTTYRPRHTLMVQSDENFRGENQPVLSVGCSAGDFPTCLTEMLKGKIWLRRPASQRSFWLTTQPAIGGRSGGPLVDATGSLIGICRGGLAADANHPAEGLYSSLQEIHLLLETAGVASVVMPYRYEQVSAIASNTTP